MIKFWKLRIVRIKKNYIFLKQCIQKNIQIFPSNKFFFSSLVSINSYNITREIDTSIIIVTIRDHHSFYIKRILSNYTQFFLDTNSLSTSNTHSNTSLLSSFPVIKFSGRYAEYRNFMDLALLRNGIVFNHRTPPPPRPWKCSKFPCGMVARGVE